MNRIICLAFYLSQSFCLLARAEESGGEPENVSQLESIQRGVDQKTAELEQVRAQQLQLERQIKDLSQAIRKAEGEEADMISRVRGSEKARADTEQELKTLSQKIARIRGLSQDRMRGMYFFQAHGGMQDLVLRTSGADLSRNLVYLNYLKTYDQNVLRSLATLERKNTEEVAKLAQIIEKQRALQEDLRKHRDAIRTQMSTQQSANKELKERRAQLEEVLALLRAQALRIETVMVSLTHGEEAGAVRSSNGNGTPPITRGGTSRSYNGEGLKTQIKKLVPPVKGQVVTHFGKQRVLQFSDFVMNKGIEYGAEPGSEVHAIAGGRTLFVGNMPGYGSVVILDHGQRSYSVYGRIDASSLRAGDEVQQGQVIAKVIEPDGPGKNFYFEIRENGRPVNPEAYF